MVSNSTINALRSHVVASQYFRSIDSSITSRENAPETSHISRVAAVRRCLGQFNFLRGCPTSSCPHGGQELRHSIKVLGQSGVAGVLKNKKILFLVI